MDKPHDFDEPYFFTDYNEYINSMLWQEKRLERLKIDNFKCAKCGSPFNLQVHHLRYPKLFGSENAYFDLVTLCRSCHESIHKQKVEPVFRKQYVDWYRDAYKTQKEQNETLRDMQFNFYINKFKNDDIVFGGKENFCKLETIKEHWAESFGASEESMRLCPCSKIQDWFRDRRIEKIFKWKNSGATPDDLMRTGISRNMVYKYWNDKELAERIVKHKL